MLRAERLLDCRNAVGESPVWDPAAGRLLWVDIPKGEVLALSLAGMHLERHQRATPIGAIALADAGLVAGTAEGFVALQFGRPEERMIAPVLAGQSELRMNDGACDRQGRFWCGSMAYAADGERRQGTLYRLAGAVATPMLDGFVVQNGLAWSPDGRTMYLSDSHSSVQTAWAFDFDTERGVPSNRRILATGQALQGRSDGAAVDTDGCYWITANDGGRIVRLTPDGREDAAVIIPTRNPTNICFGGADLRTMFITSLQRGPDSDAEAGNLFAVETPYQGLPDTLFASGHP